jgi:hypothetical protein
VRSLTGTVSCFFTLFFQFQLPDVFLVFGTADGLFVSDFEGVDGKASTHKQLPVFSD